MTEEWRQVDGFAYEVSSLGRVRNARTGHVLRPTTNGRGYIYVGLHRDGRQHSKRVHRLVALAFIPNPENKPEVNHIEHDLTNNAITNLEWATRIENHYHSVRAGKFHSATNPNKVRKLGPEIVAEAKRRHAAGESYSAIARSYGVLPWAIQRVVDGRKSEAGRKHKPKTKMTEKA